MLGKAPIYKCPRSPRNWSQRNENRTWERSAITLYRKVDCRGEINCNCVPINCIEKKSKKKRWRWWSTSNEVWKQEMRIIKYSTNFVHLLTINNETELYIVTSMKTKEKDNLVINHLPICRSLKEVSLPNIMKLLEGTPSTKFLLHLFTKKWRRIGRPLNRKTFRTKLIHKMYQYI